MLDLSKERILVTGGNGFLGKRVCLALLDWGVPIDRIKVVTREMWDLTNPYHTEGCYLCESPTVIIHLAARVGGIGANVESPAVFFDENMRMGLNILEYADERKVKKLLFVGTTCSYPEHCCVPFREDDLFKGYPEPTNAPYGIAKRALLVACQAYRKERGLNAIYLIPANMYGPGDNFDLDTSHVVPAIIQKMYADPYGRVAVELWGDGTPTRDLLYVDDCAGAIVKALIRYDGEQPVNIGTGREVSIKTIAEMIAKLTGWAGGISWDRTKPNGQLRRCLDTSRAKDLLGWQATTSLEEGLRKTIKWYEEHGCKSEH